MLYHYLAATDPELNPELNPPISCTKMPRIQQFTAKKNKLERNNPGTKLDNPRNSRRKPWWSQRTCILSVPCSCLQHGR